jgi:hypothetical protein
VQDDPAERSDAPEQLSLADATATEPAPEPAEPAPGPPEPTAEAHAQEPLPEASAPPELTTPGTAPAEPPSEPASPAAAGGVPQPGVRHRADRVVHSQLGGVRRKSARDEQLDLEAAEREAASEALFAAGEDDEAPGPPGSLEPVIPVTGLAQATLSAAEIEAATRVAIEQLPGRSSRADTCPFLRSIAGGKLQAPRDSIDGRNRCAAFREPLPLSRMQQGLVCLQPAHAACPRYVRGAMLIQERIAPTAKPATQTPVLVAAGLLLLAVAAVAAYLLLGGRLEPGPGLASPSPAATATATPAPSLQPTPPATPTARPSGSPRPTARPTILPAQYRGLERCPAPQTCFVYVVQRGDTLEAIARRFDTTVAILRRMNRDIRGDYLRVGQKVRVPPP